MPDFGFSAPVFRVESLGVADPDPHPRPGVSLVTFAQEDFTAITRDRSDDAFLVPVQLEPQHTRIVVHAGQKVAHTQNRDDPLE